MGEAREARAARYRLAAVNLVVLAVVLAITLGAAAFGAFGSSRSLVDQELRAAAVRVLAHIEHERAERDHGARPAEREDDDERGEHLGDEDDRDARARADRLAAVEVGDEPGFILLVASTPRDVRRLDGRPVPRGLPEAEGLTAALSGAEAFGDARGAGGEPLRVLTVPVWDGDAIVAALQLAKPTTEARASLARTLLILGATGLAGLALSAAGSLFLARRAMRPVERAMERQRRFIADASHELRTPVAVLRARAELLGSDPSAPAAIRGELAQLQRDADELSGLLGELLDLARLDAEGGAIELGPVPIGDLVEEVVAQLAPLAGARDVTLSARAEPVFALASSSRVRQVLRALVDNALAHTPARGHVRVEASVHDGRARLVVADDGEGIPAEHLPHVKHRFYRADSARTRGAGQGGAGLGLSIANELVERMGGELQVASAPGEGTTMTVLLSLARPRSA